MSAFFADAEVQLAGDESPAPQRGQGFLERPDAQHLPVDGLEILFHAGPPLNDEEPS